MSINEKAVEQLWDSLTPMITTVRILGALCFFLYIASSHDLLFSGQNLLKLKVGEMGELFNHLFINSPVWKVLLSILLAFIVAPWLNNYLINFLIKRVHINLAAPLFDALENLPISQDPQIIKSRLKARNDGIGKIDFFRNLGELLTILILALIYSYCIYENSGLALLKTISLLISLWILVSYILSQKVLITFLKEVAPFNKLNY